MFDQNTVIILGAGASAPFGFPLGGTVYDKLIDGISAVKRELDKEAAFAPTISLRSAHEFRLNPVRAFASQITQPKYSRFFIDRLSQDQIFNHMFHFYDDLRTSSAETIDRFLWENQHYLFIGKALLSVMIFVEMYEWRDNRLRLRTFSERTYGAQRNWYHLLINRIREGAIDGNALINQNISVVTFNYDHSLERALEVELANTRRHKGVDYRDVVDIFHVNGTVEELPEVVADPVELALQCAEELYLIDEEPGSSLSAVRYAARDAISNAECIYVMGFHFDPANIATMGLTNTHYVRCLNFDGHRGLRQRMDRLNIRSHNILSGTPNEPMHIDKAIEQGFLDG